MKRFPRLFVALALTIQIIGCGDSGSSPPTAVSDEDPDGPGEAKAYKAAEAKRLEERNAKAAATKAAKSASKNR